MPADYYDVLGVSKNATEDQLKKAYRKLSRENHPDVKPKDATAAKKFQEVQDAYSVLSDGDKRRKYDQFGPAAFQSGGRPGGGGGGGRSGPVDFSDLFGGGIDLGSLFGGGGFGGQRRAQKGQDISATIQVGFNVAAEGGNYDLSVSTGSSVQKLTIRVPAGIEHGKTIRLAGQGHPGSGGGPQGDLLVTVNVASHPYFRREGTALYVDVPISITEATLGAKVDVPTLNEGLFTITVPPGSSSGAKLRLREKGIINPKTNQRGDQFVVLKIVAPKDLDAETISLARQLADRLTEDPRMGLW